MKALVTVAPVRHVIPSNRRARSTRVDLAKLLKAYSVFVAETMRKQE